MTVIELNDQEARAFMAFRANQENIEIMLASGVFDMRLGSVEIHFDGDGRVGAITGHPTLFKRGVVIT